VRRTSKQIHVWTYKQRETNRANLLNTYHTDFLFQKLYNYINVDNRCFILTVLLRCFLSWHSTDKTHEVKRKQFYFQKGRIVHTSRQSLLLGDSRQARRSPKKSPRDPDWLARTGVETTWRRALSCMTKTTFYYECHPTRWETHYRRSFDT